MFQVSQMLPLVSQIGIYLKMAADYYVELKMAGPVVGADGVAAFLEEKMKDWSPVINGKAVMDEPTRKAGARFLAGVAVNFVK